MSDVDRLTVVVAISFIMLIDRLPEQDVSQWGGLRLTSNLFFQLLLIIIITAQVFGALGWIS